jgi:regulator of cell morphogenesis and NO signaling
MNLQPNRTVRELAVEIPGATRLFEKVGIDYCCGGQRSLADACSRAGVAVKDMITSLESAAVSHAPGEEPNFLTATLGELMAHIVGKHHVFTKSELVRLEALLDRVCIEHGLNHPELVQLRVLFEVLCADLNAHMRKEEITLFPYISAMEDAVRNSRPVTTPPFGTVANPVRRMMMEHDHVGDLLNKMRRLTLDYTTPSNACISYKTLYQALDDLEKDLHQHIHLENNILFPRAVELEDAFLN